MDVQRPGLTNLSDEFLSNLLREREARPRCALLAQQAMDLLSGGVVVVYLVEGEDQPWWVARATLGEVHLDDSIVTFDSGTLGVLFDQKKSLLFSGRELVRELAEIRASPQVAHGLRAVDIDVGPPQ